MPVRRKSDSLPECQGHASGEGRPWVRLGEGSAHFEVLRVGSPGPGACVVKRCLPEEREREDLVQRLHNEARHLDRLRGLRVPELHRLLPDPPSLVMRWVDAVPLHEWLGRRPRLYRALNVFDDLLALVIEIHERGTVHRDIKPANVLVDANDRTWLVDFELACDAGADRSMGRGWVEHAAGTVPYAAPELRSHPTTATQPALDVFSLGKVLEDMLTAADEGGDTLDFVVARATAREAHYRFEDVAALRASLTESFGGSMRAWVRGVLRRLAG